MAEVETKRINAVTAEATTPAEDDFILMDGDKNGTRRMLAGVLATSDALKLETSERKSADDAKAKKAEIAKDWDQFSVYKVGDYAYVNGVLSKCTAVEEEEGEETVVWSSVLACEEIKNNGESISKKIDDAPSDGKQYVRKDGEWKVNETVVTESEYAAMEAAGTVDPEMKYVIVEDGE